MVSYSNCARSGNICYFVKERLKKCSCCLRKNIDYDGSFSLEEFRRMVDEKKSLVDKSRRKRKEITRLRRVLADAESEDSTI
jgi:hypothetical protein